MAWSSGYHVLTEEAPAAADPQADRLVYARAPGAHAGLDRVADRLNLARSPQVAQAANNRQGREQAGENRTLRISNGVPYNLIVVPCRTGADMRLNPICQNGLSRKAESAGSPPSGRFRDVWDATGNTRAIVDADGARTTFVYDAQSHTVLQFPGGGRATLAWCQSQVTTSAALLSQFAAHVELRSSSRIESTETRAGEFLAHPESQRQITRMATATIRARSKRQRWLEDVVQQANLRLLSDLRKGKVIFAGDDPDRFSHWFSGTSRHAVIDAIKFCLRAYTGLALTDVADPNTTDPGELVMVRELGRLAHAEIGRIREAKLREVMFDLLDGKSTQESAARLAISKSNAGKLRQRGCQLVADRLGN